MRKQQPIDDLIADYTPLEAVPITDIPVSAVAPAPISADDTIDAIAQTQVRAKPGPKPKHKYDGPLVVESLTPSMVAVTIEPKPERELTASEVKALEIIKAIPIKSREPL